MKKKSDATLSPCVINDVRALSVIYAYEKMGHDSTTIPDNKRSKRRASLVRFLEIRRSSQMYYWESQGSTSKQR